MNMTKIKQMRLLLHLTQRQLAQKVGVKPPTVHTLETKGIYDTRTAKRYAAALGCSPLFLLDGLD